MDKVVHFEIPADDVSRAEAFYRGVFGWQTNSIPGMGYTLVSTVEVDENQTPREPGAINGGMMLRQGPITSPVITIGVSSIDDAAKKVEAAGGKLVQGKQAVGSMGFSAYFTDPEGNVVGLWQDANG